MNFEMTKVTRMNDYSHQVLWPVNISHEDDKKHWSGILRCSNLAS